MSKQFAVDFIEASREEASAILEFLNTVTEETDFILHTVSNQLSLSEMETFIENTLMTKNCICLIAKLKNKVIFLLPFRRIIWDMVLVIFSWKKQ